MRTPNCKCVICGKPLYRRPSELKRVRHVACMAHRAIAQKRSGITESQKAALELGRKKGTNHLSGIPKSKESKKKRSASMKRWCRENPEKSRERSEKNRGPNHYRWKGGSSRLNTSIRTMTENRKWMDAVKKRDGRCVRCCGDTNLEAHHIVPLAELLERFGIKNREDARKEKALWDLGNGITLCLPCHYEEHGRAANDNHKTRLRKTA